MFTFSRCKITQTTPKLCISIAFFHSFTDVLRRFVSSNKKNNVFLRMTDVHLLHSLPESFLGTFCCIARKRTFSFSHMSHDESKRRMN